MLRRSAGIWPTDDFPDLSSCMVENQQIVIETEPAIRQANVVHRFGGKLLDEILEVVPEIANGCAEREISGGVVMVKRELSTQNIERIALDVRRARRRDDVRATSLRADNLRRSGGENRITGRAGSGIEPDPMRFRRELGEAVTRLGPRLFSNDGLLTHGARLRAVGLGSCLRP